MNGNKQHIRIGRLRMLAAVAVAAPLLAIASSGTAWANAPHYYYVYEVTATIPVGGISAVAVNPATDTIYTTSGQGASVDVISGSSNKLTAIVVLPGSRALAVNPVTNMIYVMRYGAVSVIDGATNRVTATIFTNDLSGGITSIAVNPANNTIDVAGSTGTSGAVSVISGATNAVTATIPLPNGESADTVAVDPGSDTIAVTSALSSGDGGLVLIHRPTNTVTTLDLFEYQYAVTVDASNGFFYSEGIGDLTSPNGGAGVNFPCPLYTQCDGGSLMLAADSNAHTVYASYYDPGGVVLVYNGLSGSLLGTISVPGAGQGAINPVTTIAYVANGANSLSVISRILVHR